MKEIKKNIYIEGYRNTKDVQEQWGFSWNIFVFITHLHTQCMVSNLEAWSKKMAIHSVFDIMHFTLSTHRCRTSLRIRPCPWPITRNTVSSSFIHPLTQNRPGGHMGKQQEIKIPLDYFLVIAFNCSIASFFLFLGSPFGGGVCGGGCLEPVKWCMTLFGFSRAVWLYVWYVHGHCTVYTCVVLQGVKVCLVTVCITGILLELAAGFFVLAGKARWRAATHRLALGRWR